MGVYQFNLFNGFPSIKDNKDGPTKLNKMKVMKKEKLFIIKINKTMSIWFEEGCEVENLVPFVL